MVQRYTFSGAKRDYHGIFSVTIDKEPPLQFSGYSNQDLWQSLLFSQDGLSENDLHTITLTNLPSLSTGNSSKPDTIKWWKSDQIFTTVIDDTSSAAQYFGSGWHKQTDYNKGFYTATSRVGVGAGDYMDLRFNGSSIQIFGATNKDHGFYQIILDDVPAPYTFDGYFFQVQFQTCLYTASNLFDGPHKLTLRNIGGGGIFNNLGFDYAIVNSTIKWDEIRSIDNTTSNTTETVNTNDRSNQSHSTPLGAIIGGSIGGLAILAIILVLVWLLLRKRKNKDQGTSQKELIDLTGEEVKPFQNEDNEYNDSSHQGYTSYSNPQTRFSSYTEPISLDIPPPPGSNATSYPLTELNYPGTIGGASITPSSHTLSCQNSAQQRENNQISDTLNDSRPGGSRNNSDSKNSLTIRTILEEEENSIEDPVSPGIAPPVYSQYIPSDVNSDNRVQ